MKKMLVVFLLLITHLYMVMVGKYQIFPYHQLSNSKQYVTSLLQNDIFYKFETATPAYISSEKVKSTRELEVGERNELISPVIKQLMEIVESEKRISKPYNIKFDPLVGYIRKRSVSAGEKLDILVRATEPYSVQILRLGREKVTYRTVGDFKRNFQSTLYSPKYGLDWTPSFVIDTTSYESGIYLIEMKSHLSDAFWQIPFIVKPANVPKIAFIASTYTWYAFNPYFFCARPNIGLPGLTSWESFQCPKNSAEGDIDSTLPTIQSQIVGKNFYIDHEISGADRSYNNALDSLLDSLDLPPSSIHLPLNRPLKPEQFITDQVPEAPHHSHLLRASWILPAFAEAHSIELGFYANEDFNEHSDLMNSEIIVFDAHTEYWSDAMLDAYDKFIKKGGKVIFAGGNAMFKLVAMDENKISLMGDVPSALRRKMTGAINTGVSVPLYAPFQVLTPEHWIFQGTNLKEGATFGAASSNHNSDSSYQGASGWEADQGTSDTSDFIILAAGKNTRFPSHMLFKQTREGGCGYSTPGPSPLAALSLLIL
jgi:N,N-dimethylformamidase